MKLRHQYGILGLLLALFLLPAESRGQKSERAVLAFGSSGGNLTAFWAAREAGLQTVLDAVKKSNPHAAGAKVQDFMDNRFVKELEEKGFIQSLYGR